MDMQIKRRVGWLIAKEWEVACPEPISLANAYKVETIFDLSLVSFLDPFVVLLLLLVSSPSGIGQVCFNIIQVL